MKIANKLLSFRKNQPNNDEECWRMLAIVKGAQGKLFTGKLFTVESD